MLDAVRDWLPYPVYRFRGGPVDGDERTVRLIETEHGYVAPEYWQVASPSPARMPPTAPGDERMTVSVYRFEPLRIDGRRSQNRGFYEFVH